MNKLIFFSLCFVVVLAFTLRFYKVTEIPPSLNWDEASIAYNAYSIFKTGKDEWGKFLPLHFKSYGEYKLPVQIYGSIPAVAIFGLNELGVRLTPVLYGTLTVLVLFFLGSELFKSNIIGILSALLLAISPWHIQLTRASFESAFATFWFSVGVLLLVKGFKRPKWLIWSMVPFAVSVYTYNTTRVFTPLFLITVLVIYNKLFFQYKRFTLISIIFFIILMLPLIPFFLSGGGSARYKLVSVTDDPGLSLRVNENRGKSDLPLFLPRLVHNKVTYTAGTVADHYLAHFTPDFLFISGAPHKQHHVQNVGELYMFQAPFLLLGLFGLFHLQNRFRWLLIAWLLLSFIPVSVTNDSIPNALRTLVAVPFYQLITALGIYWIFALIHKRSRRLFVMLVFSTVAVSVLSIYGYLVNYYTLYPILYSRDWQYGYKQAVKFIQQHKGEYDEVVFTRHYGEPQMFTLFYLNYDPNLYQQDPNLVRYETYNWVRVIRFDNFYFPDLGDEGTTYGEILARNKGRKLLFVGKPEDFPNNVHILETINFLNGKPAFQIVNNL